MILDITENPFYILGADITDNKRKIISLYEEKKFFENINIINDAQEILLNPQKRLKAEMMWFSSCSSTQLEEILNYFKELPNQDKKHRFDIDGSYYEFHTGDGKDVGHIEGGIGSISALDRLNIRFYALPYLLSEKHENSIEYYGIITEIFLLFEDLNINHIVKDINEKRNISGFPMVNDSANIEQILNVYRDNIRKIFSVFFRSNDIIFNVKFTNYLMERLKNREYRILDDFISEYSIFTKSNLEKTRDKITNKIKNVIDCKNAGSSLERDVDKILQMTKEWDEIAQPIQLLSRDKGVQHPDSYLLAKGIRALALYTNNEAKRTDLAIKITKELKNIFAELPEFYSIIKEDANNLNKIDRDNKEYQNKIEEYNRIKVDNENKVKKGCLIRLIVFVIILVLIGIWVLNNMHESSQKRIENERIVNERIIEQEKVENERKIVMKEILDNIEKYNSEFPERNLKFDLKNKKILLLQDGKIDDLFYRLPDQYQVRIETEINYVIQLQREDIIVGHYVEIKRGEIPRMNNTSGPPAIQIKYEFRIIDYSNKLTVYGEIVKGGEPPKQKTAGSNAGYGRDCW